MVICLERSADLHMAQLMPLPLTVSCSSKIQIGFTFLVPAHPGRTGKRPLNGCVFVCVVTSLRFVPLMLCSSACLLDFCLFCWRRISTLLALFLMACLHWILRYTRLEIWRKIGLSADCCLCTALRTRSGACYCWIGLDCP